MFSLIRNKCSVIEHATQFELIEEKITESLQKAGNFQAYHILDLLALDCDERA